MFPAIEPLAAAIVKVPCCHDGIFGIVEFVPGLEHKTPALDDELHLPAFPGKQDVPRMRVLTLMSFGPFAGPSFLLAIIFALEIAKRLPLLFYLVSVQRQLEFAVHEVWLSTILISGDEGLRWRSEKEQKKRHNTNRIFHDVVPPMVPSLDLSACAGFSSAPDPPRTFGAGCNTLKSTVGPSH